METGTGNVNILGIISLAVNGGAIIAFAVAWGVMKERVNTLRERRAEDKKDIKQDVDGIGKKLSKHLENHP